MSELEMLLIIEATRQKLQFAEDTDDVELATNLLFALMQQYESLYQLRYTIVRNELNNKAS